MNHLKTFVLMLFLLTSLSAQQKDQEATLLIRCDDSGMSNATNLALEKLIESGIPFSTSIMFVCPWYQQAVELLKTNPQVSVGIHLTLNAEWKNYRWGPVLGKEVSSLTDEAGYFFPSRKTFREHNPKLEEVEKELTAQVARAMNSGLRIDYIDYHMGAAMDKPEYRDIVEKLAKENHLGISRYFGETDTDNMYAASIESKKDTLINILQNKLEKAKVNLMVCHCGIDTEELRAMIDMNPSGPAKMSLNRQAELFSLLSPEFLAEVKKNKIKLITYRELIESIGRENMKRPEMFEYK